MGYEDSPQCLERLSDPSYATSFRDPQAVLEIVQEASPASRTRADIDLADAEHRSRTPTCDAING